MAEQKTEQKVEVREFDVVGTVQEVDPRLVRDSLIKIREKLYRKEQILPKEIAGALEQLITHIDDLQEKLTIIHMELGSIIIPPNTLEQSYKSKLLMTIMKAEVMLGRIISKVNNNIETVIEMEKIDVKAKQRALESIRELFEILSILHIALLGAEMKILNALALNAPPSKRPPLANPMIFGYDLVR